MIGIDLVENVRFSSLDEKLINRILSDKELLVFNGFSSDTRKIEYLASRFACKEALFKAYSSGDLTTNYKDFSILNNKNGSPYVLFKENQIDCEISLSHTQNYSVAIVNLHN